MSPRPPTCQRDRRHATAHWRAREHGRFTRVNSIASVRRAAVSGRAGGRALVLAVRVVRLEPLPELARLALDPRELLHEVVVLLAAGDPGGLHEARLHLLHLAAAALREPDRARDGLLPAGIAQHALRRARDELRARLEQLATDALPVARHVRPPRRSRSSRRRAPRRRRNGSRFGGRAPPDLPVSRPARRA